MHGGRHSRFVDLCDSFSLFSFLSLSLFLCESFLSSFPPIEFFSLSLPVFVFPSPARSVPFGAFHIMMRLPNALFPAHTVPVFGRNACTVTLVTPSCHALRAPRPFRWRRCWGRCRPSSRRACERWATPRRPREEALRVPWSCAWTAARATTRCGVHQTRLAAFVLNPGVNTLFLSTI